MLMEQRIWMLTLSAWMVSVAAADDPDATECSSSFGDTMSGSEDDGRPSEISDIEVDSPFCRYPPNGDAGNLLDAAASNNMDRLLK
jgi:hypothetical protein